MKKYIILLSTSVVVACANGEVDSLDEQTTEDTYNILPPNTMEREELTDTVKHDFANKLREPCNPDKFLADSIPAGYKINPNCPPVIVYPPRIIFKGDPGPVIKYGEL